MSSAAVNGFEHLSESGGEVCANTTFPLFLYNKNYILYIYIYQIIYLNDQGQHPDMPQVSQLLGFFLNHSSEHGCP